MSGANLKQFMTGFAAASQLLQRAGHNGFLIEYVCLAAAVIDGALRIGLVLRHQLQTNSSEVPAELVCQRQSNRTDSERAIYRRALHADIINEELFDTLNALYDQRNRIIHRYIISDITTKNVFEIAGEYERVIPEVSRQIAILEESQIRSGVGMTKSGDASSIMPTIDALALEKHADRQLASRIRKDKS